MARSWTEVGVARLFVAKQPVRVPLAATQADRGSTLEKWLVPKVRALSIVPTRELSALLLASSHCHVESAVVAPWSEEVLPTSKSPLRDTNTPLMGAPEMFLSVMATVTSFSMVSGLFHTCVSWNFPSMVLLVTVRGNVPAPLGWENVGAANPPNTEPVSWPLTLSPTVSSPNWVLQTA